MPPPLKDFDASKLTSAVQIQPLDDDVDGQILFAQYHDYDFTEFLKMRVGSRSFAFENVY